MHSRPSGLPQRQPAESILTDYPDRGLLGAVLHELVVEVIKTEGQGANPLVPIPVLWNVEPVQSIKHRRPAGADKPGDFPGGHAFVRIKPLERALASQAEQGRQQDNALDQRGDCPARVCFLLIRGRRD